MLENTKEGGGVRRTCETVRPDFYKMYCNAK